MDIRIGFLHGKDRVTVKFNGNFLAQDKNGNTIHKFENNDEVTLILEESTPADFDWYEKIDFFTDHKLIQKYSEKYFYRDKPVRIEKTGKSFGEFDNFEYWVLKKIETPADGIYQMGDYRNKKIYRRRPTGKIGFNDKLVMDSVVFIPENKNCSFKVSDVRVGIGFHWDHNEQLEYSGSLDVMIDNNGKLTCVNIVDLEDYLASVNSSEMRADNNLEMLKAQTVAARCTVLATAGKHHFMEGFDLCADDHCQCYQGVSKMSDTSQNVTNSTKGEVLLYDNKIIDARYAKICGGVTEIFSSCWDDFDFPYLASFSDNDSTNNLDLQNEDTVENYINDCNYTCYCNTKTHKLPKSLEFCEPMFRWEKIYSDDEINNLLSNNLKKSIGNLISLTPLKRGLSGRITQLEIKGSDDTTVVGKELAIRKILSDTHLPSSCFYIERLDNKWIIKGAGWGHGVGLCQVGAEVMGQKGFDYKDILKHYYKGTILKKATF